MVILSHRGYWKTKSEKNKEIAFERSFSLGFGTETDIRDFHGQLVISHDIADGTSMPLEDFFRIYNQYDPTLPLALNVKADGLQLQLQALLARYDIKNYFLFDMSVPDALISHEYNLKTFTRESEYECEPAFYEKAEGIWMDEFHARWIDYSTIAVHLEKKKKVCIVSPELHGRNYICEWKEYKAFLASLKSPDLMICTDIPEEARRFFNE
jgi:hypothetical protein